MYFFDGYGYPILLIYFMLYVLNLKMTFMTCKVKVSCAQMEGLGFQI